MKRSKVRYSLHTQANTFVHTHQRLEIWSVHVLTKLKRKLVCWLHWTTVRNKVLFSFQPWKKWVIWKHTHTHTHTRARAHTHTHTHAKNIESEDSMPKLQKKLTLGGRAPFDICRTSRADTHTFAVGGCGISATDIIGTVSTGKRGCHRWISPAFGRTGNFSRKAWEGEKKQEKSKMSICSEHPLAKNHYTVAPRDGLPRFSTTLCERLPFALSSAWKPWSDLVKQWRKGGTSKRTQREKETQPQYTLTVKLFVYWG